MVNTHTSQGDALFTALFDARKKVEKRRQALADAQAALDRAVAEAVSSEPTSATWYDAPGKLTRSRVMESAGLTTMQLHRLMERYRTAHPPKRPRRRRKVTA